MSVIWLCLSTGSLIHGIPAIQPSSLVRTHFNLDFIPHLNDPFLENNGKDTLSGHNTVPNFFSDRTVLMTFLPNLCNLQQTPSNRNLCSDWKFRQSDAFRKDVFCKRAGKTFCMLFMLSDASRLICLCQSPACASPRIPQFCLTSTLSTGCLVVPRFSLMHSATTDAILFLLPACFRKPILHVLSCPYGLQPSMYLQPFTMHRQSFHSKNLHLQCLYFTPISLLGQLALLSVP